MPFVLLSAVCGFTVAALSWRDAPAWTLAALQKQLERPRGKVQVAGRLLPVGDTYRESFAELIRAHNQL